MMTCLYEHYGHAMPVHEEIVLVIVDVVGVAGSGILSINVLCILVIMVIIIFGVIGSSWVPCVSINSRHSILLYTNSHILTYSSFKSSQNYY